MGKVGISITILWISLFILLLVLKWDDALKLSLNEWGDFLAGATAPIAFLWLIIGYWLQRNELSMNTKALQTQQEELAKQVEGLLKQNDILKETTKFTKNLADAIEHQTKMLALK